ncbi:MAG: archaellin/type IV pilin N-terminal domain-containing protein [Thermoplasmatota archaeon]
MKANRKVLETRNDRGEVGIGTLIVFIAMVLVAAVSAAVLINTSNVLQSRATATGEQATQQVTSNVEVASLTGVRNSTSANIAFLHIDITLAAGAPAIDLTKMLVRYNDGTHNINYQYSTSPTFALTYLRDVSASDGDTTNKVIGAGDLVEMNVTLPTALAPRSTGTFSLVPEIGGEVVNDFTTPPTYGVTTSIALTA